MSQNENRFNSKLKIGNSYIFGNVKRFKYIMSDGASFYGYIEDAETFTEVSPSVIGVITSFSDDHRKASVKINHVLCQKAKRLFDLTKSHTLLIPIEKMIAEIKTKFPINDFNLKEAMVCCKCELYKECCASGTYLYTGCQFYKKSDFDKDAEMVIDKTLRIRLGV